MYCVKFGYTQTPAGTAQSENHCSYS